MTSSASQSSVDEYASGPIARIDAQDEAYVIPLREYLESNGCIVVINSTDANPVTYHIVAGDLEFVKHIFAAGTFVNYRRLGIVIGSSASDAESAANDTTKIIVVDPVYLLPEEVLDIFSFFFAGIQNLYDKRRNIHEHAPYDAPSLPSAEKKYPKTVNAVREPVAEQPLVKSASEKTAKLTRQEDSTSADTYRIDSIMSDVFRDTDFSHAGSKSKKRKRIKKQVKRMLISAGILLCIILFPVLWYAGSLSVTSVSYVTAGRLLKSGNSVKALQFLTFGTYWLNQSKLAFTFIKYPLTGIGMYESVRGQERLLSLYTDVSDSFTDTQSVLKSAQAMVAQFLPGTVNGENRTVASDLENLRIVAASTHDRFGLAEAELSTLIRDATFPFSVPAIKNKANEALATLRAARVMLAYANNILVLYPRLAGFAQTKTYLVLLQNSNELRPTGGFIGSVGLAKFEDGALTDFSIQDVYALDGQLKGHIDPPGPIRDLLSQEHWYLRDSNWDPDFRTSAVRAQWFYEKETGVHVDGVIAVNVPFIVELLRATGPIQLPDYADRITADNFFGKSYYYTQNNFFPGSTQKKDFLGTLTRALMTKIMTDKDVSQAGLFSAFIHSVLKRDVVFMFDNTESQSLIEHFGWGGRIYTDPGCSGTDPQFCLYDPFAVSEANVSVSKVNYFIEHDASREISFTTNGGISETVSVSLRNTVNTSPDAETPGVGGAYRTYLRFIVPSDSIVNDVRIDDIVIATRMNQSTASDLPYIEKSDGPPGTLTIGVALAVSPGTQNTIRISYARTAKLPFGKGGAYLDTLWYKHPGIDSMRVKTTVHYPLYWVATNEPVSSGAHSVSASSMRPGGLMLFVAKDGQLEYNNDVQADQMIRIKFIK